jgi:peroxin-3
MLSGAKRWLRRNRTNLAIGAAVVGGTYFVGQYVLNKITESRQKSQLDRIAKEKYVDYTPIPATC